jgi:hypothetical protein
MERGRLFVLATGSFAKLEGDGVRGDTLRILMDLDGDRATGYSARGVGAELMVEVLGGGGRAVASYSFIHSSEDRSDWTSWKPRSIAQAAASGDGSGVEISVPLQAPPASLLVHALAADRSRDFAGPFGWDGSHLAPPPLPVEPPGPDDRLTIDGHLGDWAPIPPRSTPDTPSLAGTSVDLVGTRSASRSGTTFALAETAGRALAGDDIPAAPYLLPGGPGGSPTVRCPGDADCDGLPDVDDPDDDADGVLDPFDLDPRDPSVGDRWPEDETRSKSLRGEDRLVFFFETDGDPSTGYQAPWLPGRADAALVVQGREGTISRATLAVWKGSVFDAADGAAAAAGPRMVEGSVPMDARLMFVLLSSWDGTLTDSSLGELGPIAEDDLPFLGLCEIGLADNLYDSDWSGQPIISDGNSDRTGGTSGHEIDLVRNCHNATMLFFLADAGEPSGGEVYTVYIDPGADGSADWALVFQADNQPVLYRNDTGTWNLVALPAADRFDRGGTPGWREIGIERSQVGNPFSFVFYLTAGDTVPPGGAHFDRAPDAAWSPSYTVPDSAGFGTGALALVAAMATLAFAREGKLRRGRPRSAGSRK